MKASLLILLLIGFSNLFAQVDSLDSKYYQFAFSDSSKIVDENKKEKDPSYTRLFFATTARSLKSGEVSISLFEVFLPVVEIGINNYIDLAAGMSLLPVADLTYQFFYFNLKITPYQNSLFATSVGYRLVYRKHDDKRTISIPYSINSISYKKHSIFVGIGYETYSATPVFMLGCELQITNYFKLINENWLSSNIDSNLYTFGGRLFGNNFSIDIALAFIHKPDMIPFIPWLGLTYSF